MTPHATHQYAIARGKDKTEVTCERSIKYTEGQNKITKKGMIIIKIKQWHTY